MKKLFQINAVANSGSTGRIAEELGKLVIANGWQSYIAYGRWACSSESRLIRIGNQFDVIFHAIKSLLFDNHGLGSINATKKLVVQIEKINPDIIHLHNIHGYYLNYRILFEYLSVTKIPVVWTLHDCWTMTGHCVHFQNIECNKWKLKCSNCPNISGYPRSLFKDNSVKNYINKRQIFTSLTNLTIVSVCHWLDEIVNESFLKNVNRKVIINGVDLNMFSPRDNRNIHGKSNFIILAVATNWNKTKGIDDILAIYKKIDVNDVLIVVGLTPRQIKKMPSGIIAIERTEKVDELADLYSKADVFINPTYEDTLPTVNIEAIGSGTPVITYDTGGCADIIDESTGIVIRRGDIESFVEAIHLVKSRGKCFYESACRNRALRYFDKSERYKDYWDLYNQLLYTKLR